MSDADKMFEELGYDKMIEGKDYIVYQDSENSDIYINFDKEYKVLSGQPTYDYFLDMSILKAINKKVEELGWN